MHNTKTIRIENPADEQEQALIDSLTPEQRKLAMLDTARLRNWLIYIRWGVGFYEADSPTKQRVLEAINAALSGEPSPPGMK